jgi:hypothetical protein
VQLEEEVEAQDQPLGECWLCGMEARRLGALALEGETHDLCDECYKRISIQPDDINAHRYWYSREGMCGLCHAQAVTLGGELSHFKRLSDEDDSRYKLVEFPLCESCVTTLERLYIVVGGSQLGAPKDPLPWLNIRLRATDVPLDELEDEVESETVVEEETGDKGAVALDPPDSDM